MGLIEGVTAAHNFPRERRADPREQFHRNSPKPPLRLANDTPTVRTSRLPHTGCDVDHIVRHFDWIPNSNPADRNDDPRSCRLAPCLVFNNEAISHTLKDQSQMSDAQDPSRAS